MGQREPATRRPAVDEDASMERARGRVSGDLSATKGQSRPQIGFGAKATAIGRWKQGQQSSLVKVIAGSSTKWCRSASNVESRNPEVECENRTAALPSPQLHVDLECAIGAESGTTSHYTIVCID